MKKTHKSLLKQMSEMASDGRLGDSIRAAEREYSKLPSGIAVPIKVILDFHQEVSDNPDELSQIRSLICQLLIVAYREAKRKDPDIALSFVSSFIEDYPGVAESSLLLKWCSLAQASLAFREVAHSENRLMIWQQSCKQFQAYNEFINGLLSYLIILWRISEGKSINTAVFSVPYANKIEQFISLTGGEEGAFFLFTRLAQPKIRNAIAHETIWPDLEAGKVRYTDGRVSKTEYEIDLLEFMAFAAAGSHLCFSYLAAISVIAVMEAGNDTAKSLVPPFYIQFFNHMTNSAGGTVKKRTKRKKKRKIKK